MLNGLRARALGLVAALLCLAPSFPVTPGMTVADGVATCRCSRSAFLESNQSILRWQGDQPYLLQGFHYVCPGAAGPSLATWDARRPMSPPAPTVGALRRSLSAGTSVVSLSVNTRRQSGTKFLRSTVTGDHYAMILPNGTVYWFRSGTTTGVPIGSWGAPPPPHTEICQC